MPPTHPVLAVRDAWLAFPDRVEKPHALTPGRPLEVVRLPRDSRACGVPRSSVLCVSVWTWHFPPDPAPRSAPPSEDSAKAVGKADGQWPRWPAGIPGAAAAGEMSVQICSLLPLPPPETPDPETAPRDDFPSAN